jgi:VWFA-related protein
MLIDIRLSRFLLVILLCSTAASAQQVGSVNQAGNGKMYFDVVVTRKSGPPVAGLQQQDFMLLDNKKPQTITSFKIVTGREAHLNIILVADAVNTGYSLIAYERSEIDKFLRADGGRLAYPTALTVLTDRGIKTEGNFSLDGNALSALLDQNNSGLRVVGRSAGYYGAAEQLQLSLQAFSQLVAGASRLPGRKVMVWISPGWPLMSGVRTQLNSKQQRQIFANIVDLSTRLMQGRITLYSVDPLGAGESVMRDSFYKEFLKGVSKPSQVQLGDLGLQVLAVQSGGLVGHLGNHIAGMLQDCITDSVPYYEISFDAPQAERPDEYHHLEIKLAERGLTARTRLGYYAQP